MNYPLVSVIIPNYNHFKYLFERIESVLRQTYENFEVIILDDCSTDNSREVIECYRNHPKVTHIIFNDVNSGSTFKQWNKGFDLANGDYIWIAESDDIADSRFLELVMDSIIRNDDIVLAFSSMIRIDENGVNKGVIPLITKGDSPMTGEVFICKNMLFGCHILNASSAVFKKSSLAEIGSDYKNYVGSGDYLFWIEIARTGKVVKVDVPLDYFRNHTNKVTPRMVASGIQFAEVYRIVNELKRMGYVSRIKSLLIAGFWLRKIRKCRIFDTPDIKNRCKAIWKADVPNATLAEFMYLFLVFADS